MIVASNCRRFAVLALAGALLAGPAYGAQEAWVLDGTTNIGGHTTVAIGSPVSITTPFGPGLRFDGNDALNVKTNPIVGAAAFTIEMLLRPNVNANPGTDEPRILHIQSSAPNDHRAILEGRIVGNQWYLDGFLRAPAAANPNTIASLALIDSNKLHPADRWYAYALVYDGAQMRVYLNGALELSGALAINPLAAGETWIGRRASPTFWFFSGDIAKVRFTTSALAPADLLSARIPGDYDGGFYSPGNGVNAGDLEVWRNQFGSTGPLPQTGDNADGDGDGQVDGDDLLLWQRRLGAVPPGALPVPEPGSLPLITAAVLLTTGACGRPAAIRRTRF